MLDSESLDIAQQDEDPPEQKHNLISAIIEAIMTVITKLAGYVKLVLSTVK